MGIVDDLVRGRQAFERRDWSAARRQLSAPQQSQLAPAELVALATSAYLVGDADTSIRALERSFGMHVSHDEHRAGARDALLLALILSSVGNHAVGSGWFSRAERLLAAEPEDAVEQGYLQLMAMFRQLSAGEVSRAAELARGVVAAGEQHHDQDLLAMGISSQGRLMMHAGGVREGLSLLDEAMAIVVAGGVSPILGGMAYCSMVEACQEVGDHRRMCEWTSALTRWCEEQPDLAPFTGQCAVHRGQIMRLDGDFAAARAELDLALRRYETAGLSSSAGLAHYERGEVFRLLGEQDAATLDYDAAAAHGHDPQPGLALLWLARGRIGAAVGAVRRMVAETADPVYRSQILPAAVEVLVAAGERGEAQAATEDLAEIAARFGCSVLDAAAAYSAGVVSLAREDPAEALPALREAWRAWLDLGARYEAARCRWQIALAFRALGDLHSATAELTVARRSFDELGARTARDQVSRTLALELPDGLTSREVEVLSLVANGHSNAAVAGELVLSEKTVARHLSNIFGKIGVASRTAAAAYAFEQGLVHAGVSRPREAQDRDG